MTTTTRHSSLDSDSLANIRLHNAALQLKLDSTLAKSNQHHTITTSAAKFFCSHHRLCTFNHLILFHRDIALQTSPTSSVVWLLSTTNCPTDCQRCARGGDPQVDPRLKFGSLGGHHRVLTPPSLQICTKYQK